MSLLTITKLTDAVGAEVAGIDPERLASDDSIGEAILDALEDNGVLVFRGLHLDPEAQVAFCGRLGEMDRCSDGHHRVAGDLPDHPGHLEERVGGVPEGDLRLAHRRVHPHPATNAPSGPPSCPRCRSPTCGGETEFASAYGAYETLTDADKDRYGSLRVVHSLEASQRRVTPDPTPELLAKWRSRPTHEHPLVWTHLSGRKSLVLGASADYVVGMDLDDGRALLAELLDHATESDTIYSHTWSVGDTVIWDNRGVLHRAAPYEPNSHARCCAPPCSATNPSSKPGFQ